MEKCKKCGTENQEESLFCSKCGNNLKAKKKIINNVFPLLALISLIVCFFIPNIFSDIILLASIILSIIGIVKSSKLKKEIGKRKGITLSIIILVLSSIIFLGVVLATIFENNISMQNTQISYNSLSDVERVAYKGVQSLYNSADDEKNLTINSIYAQEIKTDTEHYYKIYINCTGKNAFNATVKNCYQYIKGHSLLDGGSVYKDWMTGFGEKLDKDKIMQVYNSNK